MAPSILQIGKLISIHVRCDAEPGALAEYILALLKHNAPESDLRQELTSQLEEFLEKGSCLICHSAFELLSFARHNRNNSIHQYSFYGFAHQVLSALFRTLSPYKSKGFLKSTNYGRGHPNTFGRHDESIR